MKDIPNWIKGSLISSSIYVSLFFLGVYIINTLSLSDGVWIDDYAVGVITFPGSLVLGEVTYITFIPAAITALTYVLIGALIGLLFRQTNTT